MGHFEVKMSRFSTKMTAHGCLMRCLPHPSPCVVHLVLSNDHLSTSDVPPPPLSFPTPGKTVPHHPLGDGHQVTVPHPPLGDHTPTVHAHLQAQKLQHKTKEFSTGCVQRAANVRRPTP